MRTEGPAGTQLDSFGYDLVGNTDVRALGGTPAQSLTWDAEGHLTKVEAGGIVRSEAWYDTDGSRLIHRETTPDGSKATTLTLGDTEITSTLPAAGGTPVTTWKRHYNFDGKTVAVRDGDRTTDVQILISDRHNTAGYAIESADLAITARRSLPYGGPRGGGSTGWVSDRSFVGGTEDDTIGLTHIGAREYDPHTGRFISVDPVLRPADPQQVAGVYGYGKNNPMTYADPTGLEPRPWHSSEFDQETLDYDTYMKGEARAGYGSHTSDPVYSGCGVAVQACGTDDDPRYHNPAAQGQKKSDGALGVIQKVGSGIKNTTVSAVKTGWEFRGEIATVAAIGTCIATAVPSAGVSLAVCGGMSGAAVAVRSHVRIEEDGFRESLDDVGLDALVTGVSFGTGNVLGEALKKAPAAAQSAWPMAANGILAGKQAVADAANGASFIFR